MAIPTPTKAANTARGFQAGRVLRAGLSKKSKHMVIEHTGIQVKNIEKAKAFYVAALKPLGYKMNMDFGDAAGFKQGGHTSFWIGKHQKPSPMHVAFRAANRKAVRDFYKAAIKAGAKNNGKPGLRKDYSPDYYAAFILDKDGNNIEAVCFK